ncbi:MAG: hypothetical protein ACO3XZ_05335, partial [Ilumatobacteraceae bacterium]
MFTTLLSIVISADKAEEASGLTRFLTRPVVAFLVVIGCFIFTRISYAILRVTVRRIADRTSTNAANWWRNSVRRVGAETVEGREHRRRQRIDAATRMLHQFISLGAWIIALIA